MSDGSPGRSGTARAGAPGRANVATPLPAPACDATPGPAASVSRAFCATLVLYAESSASVGTATTFTEPRAASALPAVLPPTRACPDPTPSSVPTAIVRPSALTSMLDGYHPVGIRPRSFAAAGVVTSYTATAFTPPSVTYRVRASGESAADVGARPTFRSRNGATAIVAATARRRVSTTLTSSEFPFGT